MDQAVAAALTEREEQQDKQQSLQITSDNLLDTHRLGPGVEFCFSVMLSG